MQGIHDDSIRTVNPLILRACSCTKYCYQQGYVSYMQGRLGNILLELISHQEWVWGQCSHFMVTVWCKYRTIIYLCLAINIPTLYLCVFVTIIFLLFTIHFLISIENILGRTCSAFRWTKLLVRNYILPLKLEYHWRNGSYLLDRPPKSPVYKKDDLVSVFNG